VPLAERSLLADERCTPDELLQRMSRAFDDVRDTIAAVSAAWDAVLPRLEAGRRSLAACDELAANVGEPDTLARVRDLLDGVAADLRSDPLSATVARLDEAEAALVAARAELEAADALRRDITSRLAEGRAQLDELRRAHEAAELAYEETVAKIADPGVEPPAPVPDDVAQGLDRVEALAGAHDWRAAGDALAHWTAAVAKQIAEAGRSAARSRLPLDARNELRGLLAAYQGKAMRLGRVEDPELMSLYDQAHEVLHVAPADLDRARDLVRRYQRALTAVPAPEAKR
jgi:hypothetical protein